MELIRTSLGRCIVRYLDRRALMMQKIRRVCMLRSVPIYAITTTAQSPAVPLGLGIRGIGKIIRI